MRTHDSNSRFVLLIATAILLAPAAALPSAVGAIVDPLANGPVSPDLFENAPPAPKTNHSAKPANQAVKATAFIPQPGRRSYIRPAHYQQTNNQASKPAPVQEDAPSTLPAPAPVATAKDPCAAAASKPLNTLGISIAEPEGRLPTDLAEPCWNQINGQGEYSAARCWPVFSYKWEATCLYHQPLYFEEVNLERYGYQCGDRSCCCTCGRECCLQPAASAAHFFATIPALPYCLIAEPPRECQYTLGHYRPGSCNPWRWNWPTCDPCAAVAAGGIWTGLIFAIP